MAAVIELAPWTTLSGSGSVTLTQAPGEWVDVSEHADGMFLLDVKDITGSVRIYVDTSPSDDDGYFTPLFDYVATTGATLRISRFADAATPLMRYVRWRLASGTNWAVTFRISAVLKTL